VTTPQVWALIPAAGRGLRTGASLPKQYLRLCEHTVLEQSLALFMNHARVAGIVVVLAKEDAQWQALKVSSSARIHAVVGGAERQDSVLAGLTALKTLAKDTDWVLVHDAARACLSRQLLDTLLGQLEQDPVGGLLAIPASDTIKQAQHGRVTATLERDSLWQAQTPQMFRLGMLYAALTDALQAGRRVTDEASAMEQAGHAPRLVLGSADNLKITRAEDLALAEMILRRRQANRGGPA
jgi:2-C-methyl-D-erythritol 4-phosphate cytidylyltransferase